MVFADDTELALSTAVALANSAGEPDLLATAADLDAFYEQWQFSGHPRRTAVDLDAVRGIRGEVRTLLLAERDVAAGLVNDVLAAAQATPRLVKHDQLDWHIHAEPAGSSLATQILVETAMAMIEVIRNDEGSRIAVCAADDCTSVALDLSRNRSKKFCSTTCGNRAAVQAYRARKA